MKRWIVIVTLGVVLLCVFAWHRLYRIQQNAPHQRREVVAQHQAEKSAISTSNGAAVVKDANLLQEQTDDKVNPEKEMASTVNIDIPPDSPEPGNSTTGPRSRSLERSLRPFTDTAIPVEERVKRINALSTENDEESTQLLMALGNENTYLNYAAVQALGAVSQPGVEAYLEDKLQHTDPRVVCSAISSLAQLQGEEAIPLIAKVLQQNVVRHDGYQQMVCSACVDVFGLLQSPMAIPALERELTETVGQYLQYDYGSTVVGALTRIGDPAGIPVLLAYAERLKNAHAAMSDNPMGQEYLVKKIAETEAAANMLRQSEMSQ